MISGHYIVNTFREHRVLFTFTCVFVGLFQVLIITLVVRAALLGMVEQFYRQMPPQMQLLLGEQLMTQFSVNGAVAFGYNHPLVLVLVLAILVAILLPARHIAGEIEAGTLELLLALPVRRPTVALALWLASALALVVVIVGCWAGTGLGLLLHPEARGISALTIVTVGSSLWLLTVAVSSYTLLIASFVREGGKATLCASGLTLVLYFLNLAVVMWPTIDFLQPFTLFHYHRPQQLMMHTSALWKNAAVFGAVILACGALAVRRVSRRDIPG